MFTIQILHYFISNNIYICSVVSVHCVHYQMTSLKFTMLQSLCLSGCLPSFPTQIFTKPPFTMLILGAKCWTFCHAVQPGS